MATKKVTLSQEEQIGFAAGEIYNYLHQNGTTSFAKMKKELEKLLNGNRNFVNGTPTLKNMSLQTLQI